MISTPQFCSGAQALNGPHHPPINPRLQRGLGVRGSCPAQFQFPIRNQFREPYLNDLFGNQELQAPEPRK